VANVLKAALVGCGSLSQRGILPHLSLPDAREKVRLAAVVDTVAERVRLIAERYDVPAHFTDLESMLASTDIDLVLVASPITAHFEQGMAAIKAGKHVYIQKAMATTLAEADELLAARDRGGVKLAAAPGYELFPTTGQMRQIVQDGVLGPVYVAYTYTLGFGHEHEGIRAGQGAMVEIDPGWYYRAGAGPLPDVTVYSLQLATSVLGPVRRVTAMANTRVGERSWRGQTIPLETPDNNLVLMEFASGPLGTAVGADCRGSERTEWGGLGLYGREGVLEVTHVDQASGYPLRYQVQSRAVSPSPREYAAELSEQPYLQGEHLQVGEPHVYADIMDLVDAIRENRPPRATGEQARHVVEIIERARIAAATGQAQELTSTFVPGS
jgi:predicted dehydrogenase